MMNDNLQWKEFESNKIRSFRLEEEPEVIHTLKIRENQFLLFHEDGYDLKTGDAEFHDKKSIEEKYNINLNNKHKMEEQKDCNLKGKRPILRELLDQFKEEISVLEKQSHEIGEKLMVINNKNDNEGNDGVDLGKIPTPHNEDSVIMEFYNCLYKMKNTNKILEENVKKLTNLVG